MGTKPARPHAVTAAEIEAAAREAYGAEAKVIVLNDRWQPDDASRRWYVLTVGGEVIGRRRTRAELLQLAARGVIKPPE